MHQLRLGRLGVGPAGCGAGVGAVKARQALVRNMSRAGVAAARAVVTAAGVPDVVKVAVLVNIAGAAAALARSLVKLRHLDPAAVDVYVSDRVDARAVLGRGRWLPTMVRPVPLPAEVPVPVDSSSPVAAASGSASGRGPGRGGRRRGGASVVDGQAPLFSLTVILTPGAGGMPVGEVVTRAAGGAR